MWKSRTNWKGKHSRPQHWLDPDVLLSSPSFQGHWALFYLDSTAVSVQVLAMFYPHSCLDWGYFVSMFWVWSGD